jgi:ATP-dependent DNA helicase RecG
LPSENQNLEFKEAKTQFDNEKLFQYCVALANEGGGHLLLGIHNDPPRQVVGTQAFRDPVKTEEKIFQCLGSRVDIAAVNHPDGRVLVFVVPPRPRGTAYQYKGAYYMRSGEQLVPMSESQLRKIFSEGKPDWLEEYSRTGLAAEEVVELIHVRRFFELLKLPYPTDDYAALERLVNDDLIDVIDRKYAIRRLAAVLLAKDLEQFPELARKALRVIVYNGNSKLQTKLERHGTMGYATGFRGAVRFIGEQLPQNEVVEDAIRREVKLVPDSVIRELLANALVHQDFGIGRDVCNGGNLRQSSRNIESRHPARSH